MARDSCRNAQVHKSIGGARVTSTTGNSMRNLGAAFVALFSLEVMEDSYKSKLAEGSCHSAGRIDKNITPK